MGWVERSTLHVGTERRLITKLLGGSNLVAWRTQAADVVVGVRAALTERDDVVRHGRWREDALGIAVATQRLGIKAALALCYTSPTTKTVGLRLSVAEAAVEWLPHSDRTRSWRFILAWRGVDGLCHDRRTARHDARPAAVCGLSSEP